MEKRAALFIRGSSRPSGASSVWEFCGSQAAAYDWHKLRRTSAESGLACCSVSATGKRQKHCSWLTLGGFERAMV
jgi:hypothetical protein